MNKTFYIQTKSFGKHPLQWLKEVNDAIHFEFQAGLVEAGEDCAENMKTIIKTSKKRNKGEEGQLEKNIDSEVLNYTGGVSIGIGNISKLPVYWEVINDGGYIPPTIFKPIAPGSFNGEPPIANKSDGIWTIGNDIYTFIDNKVPKKPIEPFLYIDIAAINLNRSIEIMMNKLYKTIGVK